MMPNAKANSMVRPNTAAPVQLMKNGELKVRTAGAFSDVMQ